MVELLGREPRWGPAVIASVAGTVVFGMMMQMMGMMPMIAALVGSKSVLVAWAVHMVIGSLFGLGFAVFAAFTPLSAWASGLVYGLLVWVFGPLIVMPLWLGMPQMVFNLGTATPWYSLIGHMMYGVVTGLVFGWLGFSSVRAKTSSATAG